jgi:hypothetical protein
MQDEQLEVSERWMVHRPQKAARNGKALPALSKLILCKEQQ